MSQEQSPSPEQQPLIAQKQAGDILSKDPIAIQEALRYLDEAIPTWVLEPAEVVVEQPSNQKALIDSLRSMLMAMQDGNILQKSLESNLSKILSMQAQPDNPGFGRLAIKAGYNLNNLRHPNDNLTREEYEASLALTNKRLRILGGVLALLPNT